MSESKTVHQDTILEIDKNRNIIGLPCKYAPAKFDSDKEYLRIDDKEIVFPECVNYYFKIHEKPELTLSASWYHSKDIMPYYLNFNISQKNKDYGYVILIDLETLELIYVRNSIRKGNTTHDKIIKLDDSCLNEYRKNIKAIK